MKNELILDEQKKLIMATGDPRALFEERPLLMMRAVRQAAETGYDLHGGLFKAILEKGDLLKSVMIEGIREEFEAIIVAEYAGKGLKMLAGTGLIRYILGRKLAENMPKQAAELFTGLSENIDKSKMIRERRLGLFYTCFGVDDGIDAVEILKFDKETERKLVFALKYLEKLNFLATLFEIKQFIARHGMERYEYINNLSKAKRAVYDLDDAKIRSRYYLLEYIEERDEPIFIKDMNISKSDLIKYNIASEEKADEILEMLLEMVHEKPHLNNKRALLDHAEKFAKNPVQAMFQKMPRWLR